MTLQVFEHQKVRIGEGLSQQQWQALTGFAQQQGDRYFKVLYNGIQFSHYVGALQVGDLTIEILPKIEDTEDTNLQFFLIDMLRECRLLQPERVATARLKEQRGTLLDIYITQFIKDIEKILQEGLARTYTTDIQNRKSFKGKLLIHKQIEKNLLHKERFFTQALEYSYAHPFNQILYTALLTLNDIIFRPDLRTKLQQLCTQFPPVNSWKLPFPAFETLRFDRKTLRYKTVLYTALLILQQTRPGVHAGRLPVLAILFDMNFLFEEYVFRQLQKAATEQMVIKRQMPKPFWNRRSLQPDIVLTADNQNVVIDTKWKKLKKVSPAMDDLRQMFVYNQYFDAVRSVLVYPRVQGLEDLPPVAFQPIADKNYFCEVRFVELVKDNILNRELGKSLLDRIL